MLLGDEVCVHLLATEGLLERLDCSARYSFGISECCLLDFVKIAVLVGSLQGGPCLRVLELRVDAVGEPEAVGDALINLMT